MVSLSRGWGSPGGWECPRCSFISSDSVTRCEICGLEKGADGKARSGSSSSAAAVPHTPAGRPSSSSSLADPSSSSSSSGGGGGGGGSGAGSGDGISGGSGGPDADNPRLAWSEHDDPSGGKPKYYHNRITGESTWTRPGDMDWEAHLSGDTGAVYYFNTRTQESAWSLPPPMPASGGGGGEAEARAERKMSL